MAARSLSLAIPTYNRPDILEENLLAMRGALERLAIEVHVLDDSSDDATAAAMARLATTTQIKLRYRHNQPPLRHDANLIAALATPCTDFVWLLGDGCVIDDAGLQTVQDALQDQDFVFVNSRDGPAPAAEPRLRDAPARRFIAERAWDFSYTGATIYSRRVIDWWRADPAHQPHANFPQLSVVLGYLASGARVSLSWVAQRVVRNHPRKKQSYWLASAISVWAGDWHRVITANAAAIEPEYLASVLRSHSRHTRILGLKHLLVLRAAGLFDADALVRHGHELAAASSAGGLGVRTVAALPRPVAGALVAARPSWRRRYLPPPERPTSNRPSPAP
jgi:glycosyltransferase involved in cell wall biosynthesis